MIFKIEDKELAKLNKWMKSKKFIPSGTIGGRFTYCFTPTTLGVVVKIQDELGKSEKDREIDVTEYLDW